MKKLLCILLVSFVASIGWTQLIHDRQIDAERAFAERYGLTDAQQRKSRAEAQQEAQVAALRAQREAQVAALRARQEALVRERQEITNRVYLRYPQLISPENRIVGGKLYNAKDRALWKIKAGECMDVTADGIVVQQFRVEVDRVYGPRQSSSAERMGLVVGGYSAPRTVLSSRETEVPTQKLFLKNFPDMGTVAEGKRVSVYALLVDTVDVGGRRLECWDCGLPDTAENRKRAAIPIPTPGQITAAQEETATALKELDERSRAAQQEAAEAQAATAANKKAAADAATLKFYQERAEKGDAYGQYRMGLRYLKGEGVPKDLDKARDYLSKAAAQGNEDAAAELARLSAPELPVQTNSPPKKGEDR